MHIVTSGISAKKIKVIPRSTEVTSVILFIRRESDVSDSETVLLTSTNTNGYMELSYSGFNFMENETYFFEIKRQDNNELLYRGLIYCTDQNDIQNYKIIPEVNNNIIVV